MGLMSPVHALFGFNGRMRRRDFWAYVAIFWLGFAGLVALISVFLHALSPLTPGRSTGIAILASLPIAGWVYAALHIKRLHDVGYPASAIVSTFRPVLGWIWGFSECGLRDGTGEPNKYGPPQKASSDIDKVFD